MAKILAKNLFDYLDGLGDLPQNSVFRVVLEGEFLSLYRIKLKTFGADEIIQHYKISTSDILPVCFGPWRSWWASIRPCWCAIGRNERHRKAENQNNISDKLFAFQRK